MANERYKEDQQPNWEARLEQLAQDYENKGRLSPTFPTQKDASYKANVRELCSLLKIGKSTLYRNDEIKSKVNLALQMQGLEPILSKTEKAKLWS